MTEGFSNPLVGGGGGLVYPSIHSPNYQTLVSGWTINKTGYAEFQNIVARGTIQASSIVNTPIGSSTITGSDFQGGTMEETTITFDANGGVILIYATTVTVTTKTSGTGTIAIPASVTTAKAECWGGGGGGGNGLSGGPGGGGGEYAAEAALAVTGGGTVAYVVGGGGAGGANSSTNNNPGSNGTASTLTGTSATVTANPGGGGNSAIPGAGGTGSTNSTHFNGGMGGTSTGGFGGGGGGGGSSAGPSSTGNNGLNTSGSLGANGGAAVAGGGAGGGGGSGSGAGTAGTNGSAPGGAGGGGGLTTGGTGKAGGAGAAGQVKLTYQTARTLIGVVTGLSGTDPITSVAYPQGIAGVDASGNWVAIANTSANTGAFLQFGTSGAAADTWLQRIAATILKTSGPIDLPDVSVPAAPTTSSRLYSATGNLKYVNGTSGDGNAYAVARLSLITSGTQTINTTGTVTITGLSAAVSSGTTYRIKGVIQVLQGGSTVAQKFGFSGPSTSACRVHFTFVNYSAGGTVNYGNIASLTTANSPAYTNASTFEYWFEGFFTASASGTFAVIAGNTVSTETCTIQSGSFVDLMPVP